MYAELAQSDASKSCTSCKNVKPLSGFVRNKNTPDGFHKWCKDCLREGKRRSYLKKKAQYNAKSRAYFKENRAQVLAINAKWRNENPELMSQYVAKYRGSEKGKATRRIDNRKRYESGYRKAWNFVRRRGIEKATPDWVDRKQLVEFFKNRPQGYHVDHIVPLRGKNVCGLNVPWNLQYLPASENLRKSNKS